MRQSHFAVAMLLVSGLVSGCATGPSSTGRVVFQLATAGAGTSAAVAPLASPTITKGLDVLVISSVELVARKIVFERAEGSCATPLPSGSEHGEGEHDAEDADQEDCPELQLGPLLLAPPVSEGAQTTFSVDLPAGQYEEVELRIHKPTESPADAAFVAAHPEFLGVSIRVNGTFNGAAFTFTTDVNGEIDVDFDEPIEVVADGTTNVTLLMDVRGWFLQSGGASLINPTGLTSSGRARVEQNIRSSFRAFHDQDCDGHRD